jgi:hypothetical protein
LTPIFPCLKAKIKKKEREKKERYLMGREEKDLPPSLPSTPPLPLSLLFLTPTLFGIPYPSLFKNPHLLPESKDEIF